MNSPMEKITIEKSANIDSFKILNKNSWKIQSNNFYVRRQKEPLIISYKIDSVEKQKIIPYQNSFFYFAGNLYPPLWPGFLIDKNNPKRYAYPQNIYLNDADTSEKAKRWKPLGNGTVSFEISIPFINSASNTVGVPFRNVGGLFGISTGLNYYYSNNSSISLNTGIITTSTIGEFFGDYTLNNAKSSFIGIRNNNNIGSFSIGYGLNICKNVWSVYTHKDSLYTSSNFKNTGIGISLDAQYRFGKYFYAGLLYQPSFIWFKKEAPKGLQQFISFELLGKLPIYNRN